MAESIGEMIIPGTYIEVRAEGLIGVGGISTGTIGVVGTASKGPLDEVVTLGSYGEALQTFGAYDAWPDDPQATAHLTLTRTLEQIFRGGGRDVKAVRVANANNVRAMTWQVQGAGGNIFRIDAKTPGTWANAIVPEVTAGVDGGPATLTLTLGATRETFDGVTAADLSREINDASNFVTAATPSNANEGEAPIGINPGNNPGGPDGAGAMGALIPEIATGLGLLATQSVNILVVAGYGVETVGGTVLGHLENTETNAMERIGILGTRGDALADIAADAATLGNRRAVLVAPGIKAIDAATGSQVDLPPAYAAALIAGRLSSIAPHVSLTNKDVAVDGLTTEYTRAEQKQVLLNRTLALHKNLGYRVLRGITTDTGPFIQISVRRIVDYAKAGVRIGSNPYIGRLNNSRVRSALKATLDGFLSQMVLDEMLVSYELEVSATRSQEIAGVAAVTMTLRPTFSIDFIRVTMNLE